MSKGKDYPPLMAEPLFRPVSKEEFTKKGSGARKAREPKTEPRNLVTWFALQHVQGFCTVPSHDEVIRELKPGQKEYRQRYPTRMTFRIGEYDVCRDCFMMEADKQ